MYTKILSFKDQGRNISKFYKRGGGGGGVRYASLSTHLVRMYLGQSKSNGGGTLFPQAEL
jgi:hypothetical protein